MTRLTGSTILNVAFMDLGDLVLQQRHIHYVAIGTFSDKASGIRSHIGDVLHRLHMCSTDGVELSSGQVVKLHQFSIGDWLMHVAMGGKWVFSSVTVRHARRKTTGPSNKTMFFDMV